MPAFRKGRVLICSVIGIAAFCFVGMKIARKASSNHPQQNASGRLDLTSSQKVLAAYGKLPLSFEINKGQVDRQMQFVTRSPKQLVGLLSNGVVIVLAGTGEESDVAPSAAMRSLESDISRLTDGIPHQGKGENRNSNQDRIVKMTLVGARAGARGVGLNELPSKANYFFGNVPRKWETNIQTYARVQYKEVYPRTDLIYYGNQAQLEEDFVVKPGGDPNAIRLSFNGVRDVRIDELTGDLVLRGMQDNEDVRLRKPLVYQRKRNGALSDGGSDKQLVDGRYTIGANRQVGFEIAQYDRTENLVIDPVISSFTYLGGSQYDSALRVAVDSTGAAYVTGATVSSNFPVVLGAYQTGLRVSTLSTCGRSNFPCPDVFVSKLNASGTALVYSTYLGGTRSDIGTGIAVDSSGIAYVAGSTESPDFPVTSTGYQTTISPNSSNPSAFLTKLNSTGSGLLYSSYLGATGSQSAKDSFATAIAADNSGNAYLAGYTDALDFPTTQNVAQPFPGGANCTYDVNNGYMVSFSSPSSQTSSVQVVAPNACSWNASSNVNWITITSGNSGQGDGTVTFSVAANTGGFRGGTISIAGQTFDIAQYGVGSCADVTLQSLSSNSYPSFNTTGGTGTAGVLASAGCAWNATSNVSWIQITSGNSGSGNGTVGFTVASNNGSNRAGVLLIGDLAVYITQSGQFSCLYYSPTSSCSDAFVSKINTSASSSASLVYSTFLGGSNADAPTGIAIDSSGDAYIAGGTLSSDFPTVNAYQSSFGGGQCPGAVRSPGYQTQTHMCSEAFLTKLNPSGTAKLFSTYLGGSGGDNVATGVALDPANNVYVTGFTNSSTFPTLSGTVYPSISVGSCSSGSSTAVACPDAFVAKFNSSGSRVYSTYLGGTGADLGLAIAADSAGNAYVTGATISSNFPTAYPLNSNLGGGTCTLYSSLRVPHTFTCPDIFVSKVDPTGATLLFSTYLGSSAADVGTGIAVDSSGNSYVTGATMSTGLGTAGAFHSSLAGASNAFVTKVVTGPPDFSLGVASGGSLSATVTAGNPAVYNLQVNPTGGFTGAVNITCTGAPAQATCAPATTPATVSGISSVPFIVNVTTTKSSFLSPGSMRELLPRNLKSPVTINLFLLLVALAIFRIAFEGRAKSTRAYVHAAILIVGLATLLTACGSGSGGSGGGTAGTNPGNYSLTVTGTSGALTHNVNLTLTVN